MARKKKKKLLCYAPVQARVIDLVTLDGLGHLHNDNLNNPKKTKLWYVINLKFLSEWQAQQQILTTKCVQFFKLNGFWRSDYRSLSYARATSKIGDQIKITHEGHILITKAINSFLGDLVNGEQTISRLS